MRQAPPRWRPRPRPQDQRLPPRLLQGGEPLSVSLAEDTELAAAWLALVTEAGADRLAAAEAIQALAWAQSAAYGMSYAQAVDAPAWAEIRGPERKERDSGPRGCDRLEGWGRLKGDDVAVIVDADEAFTLMRKRLESMSLRQWMEQMLLYNCVSNGGADFMPAKHRAAIMAWVKAAEARRVVAAIPR